MSDSEASLIRRLRENEQANRRAFEEAGRPLPDMPAVRCPGCDSVEGALFWKPVRRRGDRVRLACPVCDQAVVTYRVSSNRVHAGVVSPNGVGFLSGVAGIVGAAGVAVFLAGTEPGREMVEAARVAARSRTAGGGARASGESGFLERWTSPARGGPAAQAGSGRIVLAARGDRRGEVAAGGTSGAGGVEEVRYDAALDRTEVVLAPGAEPLASELRARGWTPSP